MEDSGYKEARIVLSYIKDVNFAQLFTLADETLSKEDVEKFLEIQAKLEKDDYPLQYAIGRWNFYGYDFEVNPNVLIPRPETELLVEKILKDVTGKKKILDMGTGSGAIGVSLGLESGGNFEIFASDISEEALYVAKSNADRLKARVKFIKSDMFENIGEKFDIIVSNPPYISQKDYDNLDKALFYEPKKALLGGYKGYEFYEKFASSALLYLNAGGRVYLEIGYDQGQIVADLLAANGFCNVKVFQDYNKIDRIVVANIE